ncbi:MAG TPA: SusD/RagB family nutrient-binding outer membrane lipoprotein, partial [Chryseosolibacter sp.]|nr:SusD/RagB family nutrient-binding outer membrane lipoprotein [Chryseosolibacter sp.]
TASVSLDESKGSISGDIVYNGHITKWKKLINSFYLRLLISLSRKTGNPALNVAERFQEIISNPDQYPVMTDNSDNAVLTFYDVTGNRYPYFNSNSLKTAYYLDESFVNLLKERDDPRLFVFADPEPQGVGLPASDPDAYGGLGGSASLAENITRLSAGEGSPIDSRFHSHATNEPSVLLGYAEVEFTLAEAAARGWIAGAPAPHYEKGIRASMEFYGVPVAVQNQYLSHPEVAYLPASGIEQIITQKYINFFMNGGWEVFYNHLRTGFPVFEVSGEGMLNNGLVPKRWMYPSDELLLNANNVAAAISRQYPGGDNINGEMWLLKNE